MKSAHFVRALLTKRYFNQILIIVAHVETWKSFMSKIPSSRTDLRPMYNQEDIQTIESVSTGNNAVDILLGS